MKKITVFILTCLVLMLLAQVVWAQTVRTLTGKGRVIRTGESLDALRASTLQTADFAFEILTDQLKVNSDREDKTIIPWEEIIEKYSGLWNNNIYQMEVYYKENKMDVKELYEWKKGYDKYFAEVYADGYQLLHWKWKMEMERILLDYDLKDFPGMKKGYQDMLREANKLLDEAESVGSSDPARANSLATQAVNMAEKVASGLDKLQKFIEKERKKKKTGLDSNISAVKSRLQAVPSNYSHLMSRWNETVAGWAPLIDAYWKTYQDTWKEWEKDANTFTRLGLFNDLSHFNGVKYADLKAAAEKVRSRY
ncbi:MAG: hypothetical protein JXQ27_17900 [Acidobacteria bacterium]|nr:hypothetical protein [Acidobacteriota bacterium]